MDSAASCYPSVASAEVPAPTRELRQMGRSKWVKKVLVAQGRRNPDQMKAALEHVEVARRHEEAARKCKAVKGLAVRSRALAVEGLKQMAEVERPEDYSAVQARWSSAQQVSRSRQETKYSRINRKSKKARRANRRNKSRSRSASPSDGSHCSGASSPASILRAASDSEEEAMGEAAGLVGASNAIAMVQNGIEGLNASQMVSDEQTRPPRMQQDAGSDTDSSDSDGNIVRSSRRSWGNPQGAQVGQGGAVTALLQQLVKEPSDESECAAKFGLYEGYASEVENMRNTLFNFHLDSCSCLPSSISSSMDRQIRNIDSHEAMGIPDMCREWFVYHMMRQAERNNLRMAGILEEFDKKLKFLATNDQAECPICLEEFNTETKVPETLGCCHKVCTECWTNWTKVSYGRPFCPLCKHDEFMSRVAARAAEPRHDSDSGSDGEP